MAEETIELGAEQLPFSLEAEQSVLGAILIEPECISRVLELLTPDSFYRPQHKQLFTIMLGMFTAAQPIDFVTVLEQAKADRIFASDGDAKVYLTQLVQVVPSASNVEAYAKLVQEKYYMRTLIDVAKSIITNSEKSDADARGLMEFAEQKLYEIRQGKDATGLVKVDRAIFELYDKLQRISGDDKNQYVGIPSGFSALDSLTTGLNRTDLILLAARPAMGKSTFVMNIATNVAKQGHAVAVFSLEMSREQLVQRMLCSDSGVNMQSVRTGTITDAELIRIASSLDPLSKASIYIDDSAGCSVAEIRSKCRRLQSRVGLDMVVIDYLQLMQTSGKYDNRVLEISETTRKLKILARELNVPIILLSQLSRGPEQRTDHRPVMADLRESGAIEQDADVIMLLYRPAVYDAEADNTTEVIVAKHRNGPTATVKLAWIDSSAKFADLDTTGRDEGF